MAARAHFISGRTKASDDAPALTADADSHAIRRFGGAGAVVWTGALASMVLHVALGIVVATVDTYDVDGFDLTFQGPPPVEAELPVLAAWTPDEPEEEDLVEDVVTPEPPEPVEEPEPEPEPEPEVAEATHNDVEPEPKRVERRKRVVEPAPEPEPEPETEAPDESPDAGTTAYAEPMATDSPSEAGTTAPPQDAPTAAPAAATGVDRSATGRAVADRETDGSGEVDRGRVEQVADVDIAGLQKAWLNNVDDALHKDYPYPRTARRRGLEGRVKLKIWVDAKGAITKAKVHRSSGHESLDEAALEAVLALARVPVPPREIGWRTTALIVPFDYRLGG